MPRPIDLSVRKAIVEQHGAGRALGKIAEEFGLSYGGVRKIWKLWQKRGELRPDYRRCGHCRHDFDECVILEALKLKKQHPQWGAGYIRTRLKEKWPQAKLPHVSTMWSWFTKGRLIEHRSRLPTQTCDGWATQVHQVWQIDAKEAVRLDDGSWACWLDVTDEHSGAGLASIVFPPQVLERD